MLASRRIVSGIQRVGVRRFTSADATNLLSVFGNSGVGTGLTMTGMTLGTLYYVENRFESKVDTLEKKLEAKFDKLDGKMKDQYINLRDMIRETQKRGWFS